MKRVRPTARDVAELAGVSVATVSHVVNGRGGRFGADTRDRVLAAVSELGYAPNSSARGLRRQRTDQVALLVGSIGVPANDRLTAQLHEAADAAGYGVLTLLVDSELRARHALDLLHRGIADGAVISDPYHCLDDDRLASLAHHLSMVVMDNTVAPDGFDVLRMRELAACAEGLDQLIGGRRRRVAFIGHHSDLLDTGRPSERYTAYTQALERHGLERDERLVVSGADDRSLSYWAMTGLLQLADPPDAVFCASDRAAVSAIWAIRDAGMSVPSDVAVLGAGNIKEGLITRPALSTVGLPHLDFGEVVRLLFERLAALEPLPGREVVKEWAFIPRGST
ncbi:LacI family transcriptional regulator [Streptomyces sp. A7024]|uniref:LacI family transcriptional regulator n=1 Tax=Streptomyces coryli TaxID=1128680 RepID=A0A6G4TX06_9ACTN|nr:LacI family DNA-binding transcriptional regulator [Streptomyces coryli]NGN63577.1 LacI family transcriptional regulator [Streptomyces coryli]